MPAPAALPTPEFFTPALLTDVLAVSLTAINLLRPLYETRGGELVDFAIEYLNPAAQRMTGLGERPGGTLRARFPDTFINGVFDLYQRVFATGEAERYDFNYQADGFDNYFHVAARRSGEWLVVSFTDTADQPRTVVEEALRQSQAGERAARAEAEQRQRELQRYFEQAPVGACLMKGPAFVVEMVNQQNAEMMGSTPASLLGRPLFEAVPAARNQGFEEMLQQVFQGETVVFAELPVTLNRAHLGLPNQAYFRVTYQPWREASEQITGILAVAVEVTDQVVARQQVQTLNEELAAVNEELRASNEEFLSSNAALAASQQELRELNEALEDRVAERTQQVSKQRAELQRLFAKAPVPITVLRGPRLVIELANEAMGALWGQPVAGALGRPHFEALPALAGQGFEELLAGVLQTGQPLHLNEAPVTLDRPQSGRPPRGYFNFVYQPLYDEQQQITGLVAVGTEVTDQVLARQQVQDLNEELAAINEEMQATNEELNESNRQLTRTNADLDNFIYTASHDLKAPISNIEGLLRLLEDLLPDDLRTDDTLLPVLTKMQEAVERFTRTIGHLTDVSKLQAEFTRPPAPTRLDPVVADVRQDLAPLLAETGGQLAVDVADCPTLLMSEKNLRSVLYNLLSNALKYRHPDRPPRVQLSCLREDGRRVLRVHDNGLGLSLGQQTKLFGLFERLHTHVEGTGVGLYMAKKMVENAHGTLTVASREGEGTTFTASFPA